MAPQDTDSETYKNLSLIFLFELFVEKIIKEKKMETKALYISLYLNF